MVREYIAPVTLLAISLDMLIGLAMPSKIEYKDLNKDGINDKITQTCSLTFPRAYFGKKSVEYGVKVADGKIIYLPAGQINGLEEKSQ